MEEDKKTGLAKRAARSAGRGAAGFLNWSIGHILKLVLPIALMVAFVLTVLWGGGYYWQVLRPQWAKDQLSSQGRKVTQPEIDEANLTCGLRMGWEDGNTDEERLFAIIAGYNLSAEMQTGMCDISRKFWTLRAPGHPALRISFRPTEQVDYFKDWTPVQLAQYAQLKKDFERYRETPKTLLDKYPWLSCVTRYQRTTYALLYPWPDKKLDETMKLVYKTASGAKYFCPN